MARWTFSYSRKLASDGKRYDILTSNEYPWMNVQVLEFSEDEFEKVEKLMKERHEYVTMAPDRRDFCCIQAGGGTPEHPTIEVNDANWAEVGKALRSCQEEAALYWAENGEKLKREYKTDLE